MISAVSNSQLNNEMLVSYISEKKIKCNSETGNKLLILEQIQIFFLKKRKKNSF